ncbi:MAG TPA: hypothetical protein VJK48_06130 [Chlamydiales bacterium]|nr:hypothetical protein [Chlamydiales bacterium]
MRKISFPVTLFLFFCFSLSAQEEVGAASMEAVEASSSSTWKNWVFAGSALVTAVVGVVIISTNTGTYNH